MSLSIHTENGVALLTIDRPERRNALDDVAMRALADAFDDFADDDAVRVVVLTATGDKAFSAGVDLAAFAARLPTGPDDDWYALGRFLGSVYPKPIVAAVNGVAVAGGLEILLACDVIVAAEHASFGIPEVKRGLIAAGGGTDLPRRIPLGVALELGLTGERIDAARAYAIGLVNHVCPAPRGPAGSAADRPPHRRQRADGAATDQGIDVRLSGPRTGREPITGPGGRLPGQRQRRRPRGGDRVRREAHAQLEWTLSLGRRTLR